MRGWVKSRTLITVAGLAMVALQACNPRRVPLSDQFKEAMADWSAGKAVDDALRRQIEAPDQSDSMRGTHHPLAPGEPIWIQSGKSRIVNFSSPVRRVSISDPELAGIVVLGPSTLLINAKIPKETAAPAAQPAVSITTNTDEFGKLSPYPLTPAPTIYETSLVAWDQSGTPSSHTLFVATFIDRQVMLEVTVAEINRTSLEEHGIDFRQATGTFDSAMFMGGGVLPSVLQGEDLSLVPLSTGTTRPNFAFRLPKDDISALIQVLQSEGMATILAQPKILAMSGQYSLFQSGGEVPIQNNTAFAAQVEFKPFGTLVNFLPRVSEEGDIILTVTPEVSQPDPALSVPFIGGSFASQVPGFRTRRISTTARLKDGETLVLGGLMQTQRIESVRGVPYLQDIPIAGFAFRDTRYDDTVTELMVVVTPHIVNPIPAGESLALPTDRPPLTMEEVRTKPEPEKATRPRFPGLGTPGTLPGLP